MIFLSSLASFKSFLGKAASPCADFGHVCAFIVGFLLPTVAHRSVTAAAAAILSQFRDAGNLLRFLGGSASPAVLLAAAQRHLLEATHAQPHCRHVLILAATQQSHQGTHSQNAFSSRNTGTPKGAKSTRKQKQHHPRRCHTFVFALLLCPDGRRIPYWLPFYTAEHCRLHGWQHYTQADLAAQLIRDLPLKDTIPVVVVGDTAFDAKQIRAACARRHYLWVVPINPERRLAGTKPRPQVKSLCQSLQAKDFRRVSFRLDEGVYAFMARMSPSRRQSLTHQRTYWVQQRTANVLSVGETVLLFSNRCQPKRGTTVPVQKILMSNATTATTQELLRWYALRWQIELSFKELKSELGLSHYRVRDFARVVGWVNLCVLAFCYLEYQRVQLVRGSSKGERAYWEGARTHTLKKAVRLQVERADLRQLLETTQKRGGRKRLNALLDRVGDDPTERRGRRRAA